MKLMIINGPSINMTGIRETDVYGTLSYTSMCNELVKYGDTLGIEVLIKQSNHEGYLIDYLQEAYFNHFDGVIINPGAYTHTSIALMDAINSIPLKCVEVHLSNIYEREEFRHKSYIKDVCATSFLGEGINSYKKAISYFYFK